MPELLLRGWGILVPAPAPGWGEPKGPWGAGVQGKERQAPGSGPQKPARGPGESRGRLTQGFPQEVGWHLGICKEDREDRKGKNKQLPTLTGFSGAQGKGKRRK